MRQKLNTGWIVLIFGLLLLVFVTVCVLYALGFLGPRLRA